MIEFASIHNHDGYSLLDGLGSAPEYIKACKEKGIYAFGITNHGNTSAILQYYEEGRKQGYKTLLGEEFYIEESEVVYAEDKKSQANRYYHLVVLAKNDVGYKNLVQLSSLAYSSDRFYYRPRITFDDLFKYKEGLICTSACIGGPIAKNILNDNIPKAKELAKKMKEEFKEDWFLEMEMINVAHDWDYKEKKFVSLGKNLQEIANKGIIQIGRELDIPIIVAIDAHMVNKEDKIYQDIAIKTAKSNNSGWHFHDAHYLQSVDELWDECQQYHSYITRDMFETYCKNTVVIADRCNVELEFKPQFPTVEGGLDMLCKMIAEKGKINWNDSRYTERLKYEIDVIHKNGTIDLLDYFFVLADLVDWCRENNVIPGPGRGSACGSLLTYAMGITAIDPIEYDLLFERFLSLPRILDGSLPDIDLDFSDQEAARNHLIEKYGEDKVFIIGTVQQMKIKQAFTDVCKVILGEEYDFKKTKQLARGLPSTNPGAKLILILKGIFNGYLNKTNKESDSEVVSAIDSGVMSKSWDEKSNTEWIEWIRTSSRGMDVYHAMLHLLGLPRQFGGHACGIGISKTPMAEIIPISRTTSGPTTQYTHDWCEYAGIIKFDILGLNTLKDIQECLKLMKERYNTEMDIYSLKVDDKDVLRAFATGDTNTVFQSNTDLQKHYLKEVEVKSLLDLAVVNALVRPGPLSSGVAQTYIDRRQGREVVTYEHPLMESVTGETFGTMIFQEQIMKFFNVIGGFSLVDAEKIRKALGKKKVDIMRKYHDEYILNTTQKLNPPLSKNKAQELWDMVENYCKYSFNKCISGDETVLTIDNSQTTIEEMFRLKEEYGYSYSLDENHKLVKNKIKDIRYSGIKDIYRISLKNGRSTDVTRNHKFPTTSGETTVSNLKVGDNLFVTLCDCCELNNSPAQTSEIESIKLLKIGDVYDVEMEAPYHTFTTGQGIVTSNSHAVAYSYVAYVCQYLKVHYPLEWWCAVMMNGDSDDFKRFYKQAPVNMSLPDINDSKSNFYINTEDKVVIPFTKIRGVGEKASDAIVETQPYTSFVDFYERVNKRAVRKNVLINLILAGCFDKITDPRVNKEMLIQGYYYLRNKGLSEKKKEEVPDTYRNLDICQIQNLESSVLEFKTIDYLKTLDPLFGSQYLGISELIKKQIGHRVFTGGQVVSKTVGKTKKGKKYCQMMIRNDGEDIKVSFWKPEHEQFYKLVKENDIVRVGGDLDEFRGEFQIKGMRIDVVSFN